MNKEYNIADFLPTTERKPKKAKPRYQKPESVKQLEQDYFCHKYRNSVIPSRCRFVSKFRDDSANGLTDCIDGWCQVHGAHFQRMNSQGQYDAKLKRWRRSGTTKGISDCLVIYNGQTINIEIKYGRDRQSEAQQAIQASIEASGGIYWLVRSFDDFLNNIESF